MKKMKFYAVLLAVLALVLVGCTSGELTSTKKEVSEVAALKTDQNVMVFSALSSANALGGEITTALNEEDAFFKENKEELEIDMDKANGYLLMMENILANGGPVISTETESDREGYDLMMTITVNDLAGNSSIYTIYYSIIVEDEVVEEVTPELPETGEVVEEEKTEDVVEPAARGHWDNKDDRDDREHDEKDREEKEYKEHHDKAHDQFKNHHYEDKEDEMTYGINALAIIDGVEYEVFGKKDVETEEDGEEVEIKFIVRLNEENFVTIEQEIEENEVEYKYEVFKNGRRDSSLSFKSEEEDGKTFIKLTTTSLDGERETYKFTKGEDVTIIKYESKGYSYTLIVKASVDAEGNIVYDYKVKEKEGFNWNHKRGPKGDHKHN